MQAQDSESCRSNDISYEGTIDRKRRASLERLVEVGDQSDRQSKHPSSSLLSEPNQPIQQDEPVTPEQMIDAKELNDQR